MQVTVDILSLNKAQKDALVGFILTFPATPLPQPTLPFTPDTQESYEYVPALDDPQPEAVFAAGPTLVPEPPADAAAPSTDRAGLPWDERIHASSKALTADGYWRKKRGVTDALVAQVESENGKAPAPAAVPAPPAQATTAFPPPPVSPAPVAQLAALPAPPAPVGGDQRQQLVALFGRASAALQAGKITQAELTTACEHGGVTSLPLLTTKLDAVAQVAAEIDLIIASRG